MSQPWSDVAWRTSSGTSVTWSGRTCSTISTNRASGFPSMLYSSPGELAAHQLGEFEHVGAPDMALVGARMHGNAVSPGCKRDAAQARDTRPRQVAPVAQVSDGIDIYG
jgi:hypothetical protein